MPNFLQRGATWLGTTLQTAGGLAVLYRRGVNAVGITATPQMHKETVAGEEDGVATEVDQYGWIMTASEMVGLVSMEPFEPQERDVIEETVSGKKWQVLPPGNDMQCWEEADPNGLLILVHVKRMP